MKNRGDASDPELAFAEFLYRATASYNTSAAYRRRLNAESPTSTGRGPRIICPSGHPHAQTINCYQRHRCGCEACRVHATSQFKAYRMARAQERWRREQNEETRTA